jgi:hypothetical protein
MHDYECKACGAPASFIEGQLVRTCEHTTTVVTSMAATATGQGRVKQSDEPDSPFFQFFLALGEAIQKRIAG